jgi:crossover junction endodeoxyribonuclease RuvC
MRLIGIDPGKDGGLSYFTFDGSNVSLDAYDKMPTRKVEINKKKKTVVDEEILVPGIKNFSPDIVVIEQVTAMPGQGVVSMFSFGFSTGLIHGIVYGLGLKLMTVRPQKWKAVVLDETDKDKIAAIDFCKNNFPGINLCMKGCRKDHDGVADAICIGVYGMHELKRTQQCSTQE